MKKWQNVAKAAIALLAALAAVLTAGCAVKLAASELETGAVVAPSELSSSNPVEQLLNLLSGSPSEPENSPSSDQEGG